jgi:hypothetical protein
VSRLRTEYKTRGFVVVRGLFPTDLIARAAEDALTLPERFGHLISRQNMRCRFMENVFTGETEFEVFDPVIEISPICAELAFYPPLLDLVQELYGEPPCLFKDKLIFKKPGLRGYKLHQDWPPWPGFPKSFNTVVVPFEPVDRNNGCTIVYPGYHTNEKLPTVGEGYHEIAPGLVDESTAVPLELEPGDIAVFTAFTPHRSDPNTSDRWRRQLFLSYNKLSEGGEQREKHYAEFHQRWRARLAAQGTTDLYYE